MPTPTRLRPTARHVTFPETSAGYVEHGWPQTAAYVGRRTGWKRSSGRIAEISTRSTNLEGFEVAALDGDIGKIDDATYDVGSSYIVVDTGPWIFGKKVLIPAATVVRVDLDSRKVFLMLTKDQIKDSPELSDVMTDADRDRVGLYYEKL